VGINHVVTILSKAVMISSTPDNIVGVRSIVVSSDEVGACLK